MNKAVRSAQFVAPKETFSTLTPVITVPSLYKMAQPTGKLEYGQYECSNAFFAYTYSSSGFIKGLLNWDYF